MDIFKIILLVLLCFTVSSCSENSKIEKRSATSEYLSWFVENQSGESDLAKRLVSDFQTGWDITTKLKSEGSSSADIADALRMAGLNTILLGPGISSHLLPGRTTSFLVMNTEEDCTEITMERWTSMEPNQETNMALVGMGMEDVNGKPVIEKKLHLMAVELPESGDYVELSTNSFSPLGKGIIAFGTVLLLTGCPDPAPPPPTNPVGGGCWQPTPAPTIASGKTISFASFKIANSAGAQTWLTTSLAAARTSLATLQTSLAKGVCVSPCTATWTPAPGLNSTVKQATLGSGAIGGLLATHEVAATSTLSCI